jgi:inositol-1,3,4-trisphosphate 5/6-kinase/inositol-tetrakisphosphate 1-kinase
MSQQGEVFLVGYALDPKKADTIITHSLIDYAKGKGIHFAPIDAGKSILDQGPFNCIVHKLYSDEWKEQLQLFSSQNPSVVVIDKIDEIDKIHNRESMLEVVDQLKIDLGPQFVVVPKQIFFHEHGTVLDSTSLQGLGFPVIAKPLAANGSELSHKMALIFNNDGLKKVEPPIVLQEFVNHGGVIFKVYVAGKHVRCVKRKSLPDISEEKYGITDGILPFSQISNSASEDENHDLAIENAKMPPSEFVDAVGSKLQQALKIHLFNFDMIRDNNDENRYLVIDINYFPGFFKIPSYESMLTDFFLDIANQKQNEKLE